MKLPRPKDFLTALSRFYLAVLAGLFINFLVFNLAHFLGAPLILQHLCGTILGVIAGLFTWSHLMSVGNGRC